MNTINKILNYPLNMFGIIVVSIIVFLYSVNKPFYNWDMIGYVASAYKADGYYGKTLHTKTYIDVRESTTVNVFSQLTAKDSFYRNTVYTQASSLEQQIPFYAIRLAYVSAVRIVGLSGLTYSKSTILVSAMMAAFSVIIFGFLSRNNNIPFWFFIISVSLVRFTDLGRFSTPDAMAAFGSLLAVYFVLIKSKKAYVAIMLLPLFRTDFILVSLMLTAIMFWEGSRKVSMLAGALSILIFKCLNIYFENYGWLKTFNFTFINLDPYPLYIKCSSDFNVYFEIYKRLILKLLGKADFYVWIFTGLLILRKFFNKKLYRNDCIFALIPLAYIFFHLRKV